jgi:methylthioribose-1-phosphate isomerase
MIGKSKNGGTTMPVKTISWECDRIMMIDQSRLPTETVFFTPESCEEMWEAIRRLKVRGAPAIGIAAAFGLYLAARASEASTPEALLLEIDEAAAYLATARPTAVNLCWALRRLQQFSRRKAAAATDVAFLKAALLDEARAMITEDNAVCLSIGYHGLELLLPGMSLLTHCNAGGLGTAQWGTALAPIYLAHEQGWPLRVFADETRPVLQGARLTAWELQQAGVHVVLICDNMAGTLMHHGWIEAVIVGTDRVAANGDVVNKIGTYSLAVLAHHHGIPFYVAAPRSSIDLETPSGEQVTIEERETTEITYGFGVRTAPEAVEVYNPAFDVTPAKLVTAMITEVGLLRPPYDVSLAEAMSTPFSPSPAVRERLAQH